MRGGNFPSDKSAFPAISLLRTGSPVAPAVARGGSPTGLRTATPDEWTAALETFPERTVFHTPAWMQVMASAYGYVPHLFTLNRAGTPSAMLPVLEVNSRWTGRRGVCLPFTDFCSPLAADAASFKELFEEVLALGRKRRWRYFEVRGGRRLLPEAPVSTAFLSHEVLLGEDEAGMFAAFDGRMRTGMRKAEKNGVLIEFSAEPGALLTYYELHEQTRKKHGVPPQPFRFFQAIAEQLFSKGMGITAVARVKERPVAAAVFLNDARTAVYKFGASNHEGQVLHATNLLLWEAIRRYAQLGCRVLHMGRTSLHNTGLRKFKLGWAAREEPLEYFRYDLTKEQFTTAPDQSSGWKNRVFRSLPPRLSRVAGAILYPHMG